MKDPYLNQRLGQQEADTIKLLWKYDLLSPSKTGKCFTRNGLRVAISQENIDLANSLFARGAKDLRFIGRRVAGFSATDVHFILELCEIVRS